MIVRVSYERVACTQLVVGQSQACLQSDLAPIEERLIFNLRVRLLIRMQFLDSDRGFLLTAAAIYAGNQARMRCDTTPRGTTPQESIVVD